MSKADQPRMPNYLDHILYAIVRIKRYTDEMTEAAFLKLSLDQTLGLKSVPFSGQNTDFSNISKNCVLTPVFLQCGTSRATNDIAVSI